MLEAHVHPAAVGGLAEEWPSPWPLALPYSSQLRCGSCDSRTEAVPQGRDADVLDGISFVCVSIGG